MTTVRIAPRFQGPAQSGNGGYVAGLVGTALAGCSPRTGSRVRLLVPPPMETDLELAVESAHGR